MFRVVLIDLSGTLHIEDQVIPGCVEALKRLRSSVNPKFHLRFVTNTTKESRARLASRLTRLGFDISENEMHTSLSVARDLVVKNSLNPLLFLEPEAMEEFEFLQAKGNDKKDSVLIGLNPDKFDYKHLNEAFHLIKDHRAPLIAIHKNRYFKKKSGLALGPGPFVTALEYATGVKAQVVGKPEPTFFRQALDFW
jgi:HAD superfamily hydrolase (TIGR01458 family)